MTAIIPEILAEIDGNSTFLITSHEGPDADAVGSTLALANYLSARGKDVTIYLCDPVPENCTFLPMADQALQELPDRDFDVCFVLDIGEFRRAGAAITTSKRIGRFINIDHHLGCENFGVHNLIDPTACATAALVYRIIKARGDRVDFPTALCIYTAVLSDTGSFHYSNANPESFAIAGEMIACGVKPWDVSENLYESEPPEKITLLALALTDLTISPTGEYASLTVTQEMYRQTGGCAELTDGFINFPRKIRGVQVALLFREINEGVFKVGFRSKGKVDVSAISATFGGGGHRNAAGCVIKGSLAEVKALVFERLEQGALMLDGFFVIDKPVGVTSHDIVAMVRRAIGQKKVGHTGTLDPFATGVLPVAVGEGTKAIQFLDESEKEYRAVLRLGISTDTQDRTGQIVSQRDWSTLAPCDLIQMAKRFTGKLSQLPPMFSALKQGGVPLYKLARQGVEVEREPREVEIFSLAFDWIKLPEAAFTVRCSRGTYVRTLACDLGEALGCGAHLLELRRTRSGLFLEDEAIPIEQLRECSDPATLLFPLDRALSHLKLFHLTDEGGRRLANGIAPLAGDLQGATLEGLAPDEQVRLFVAGRIAAVARFDSVRGLRLSRVFN